MDSKDKYISFGEYAEQRNISANTLSAYVKKHPEIEKDVKHVGKKAYIALESEGYKLLDEQYPLPAPVHIIQGVPDEVHEKLQQDYAAALKMVNQLLIEKHEQLAEQQRLLLLSSEQQKQLEEAATEHRQLIAEKEKQLAEKDEQLQSALAANERLMKRGFWDRLLNKEV